MGTDGPMVRLAKEAQYAVDAKPVALHNAIADLAGPCGTCGGSGSVRVEFGWFGHSSGPCPTCDGTGIDPLAKAREADAALEGLERGDLEMRL